jgi:hypothetical protein
VCDVALGSAALSDEPVESVLVIRSPSRAVSSGGGPSDQEI